MDWGPCSAFSSHGAEQEQSIDGGQVDASQEPGVDPSPEPEQGPPAHQEPEQGPPAHQEPEQGPPARQEPVRGLAVAGVSDAHIDAVFASNVHIPIRQHELAVFFGVSRGQVRLPVEEKFNAAVTAISGLLDNAGGPVVFKIGISSGIKYRFLNRYYGYVHFGYKTIHSLALASCRDACQLEVNLISRFKDRQGCANDWRRSPGGDGVNKASSVLYFVYVALKPLQ